MIERLLLVDLGAIYWHAWHSSNRDMPPDAPADATVSRVQRWAEEYRWVAICLDDPAGNFRYTMYPAYKSTRSEKPEGATAQLRRAIELLRREGFCCWQEPNHEADDVIASATALAVDEGIAVTIATRDKDLHSLVGDSSVRSVEILDYTTGNTRNSAMVLEKYGVNPLQIPDWLALAGDTSDCVPGCPGVGEKTAAELLTAHRTINAVYDWLDKAAKLRPEVHTVTVAQVNALERISRSMEPSKQASAKLAGNGWAYVEGDKWLLTSSGEELLRHCREVTRERELGRWILPTTAKALLENRETVELARRLVALVDVLPVPIEEALLERDPMPESDRAYEADSAACECVYPEGCKKCCLALALPEPADYVDPDPTVHDPVPVSQPAPQPQPPAVAGISSPVVAVQTGRPAMAMKLGRFTAQAERDNIPGRFIVYGPGSVGKTTLVASAPKPLVISCEDGAREFCVPVVRFDTDRVIPSSLGEVNEVLQAIITGDVEDRQTLVLDGVHALDRLVQEHVLKQNPKWRSIQTAGFGVGEAEVLTQWHLLAAKLEQINRQKRMRIILTAHSNPVKFKDPEGPEYDRYDLAVTKHPKGDVAAFLYGWSDTFAFARFERLTQEVGPQGRQRTVAVAAQGDRMLHLAWTNAYQAKTRLPDAPESIKLTHDDGSPRSWADVFGVLEDRAPDRLRAELESLMGALDEQTAAKTRAWIAKIGDDVPTLSRALEKLKNANKEAA